MNNIKSNEKGSVTLIVLVTILFIVIILSSFLVYVSSRRRAQIKETEAISENYDGNMEHIYNSLKTPLAKITGYETTNTDTTDKNGNRIVVPAGFRVVNPDDTVNNGIVIEDVSANNANTVGNQFVWIPCEIETQSNKNDGKLKYDRYAFTRESPTWAYRQSLISGTNGEYEKDSDGSYKIQRADQTSYYYHEAMKEKERVSIENYGGYYIGRYEVGVDSARSTSSKGSITAVARIKVNLPVYNYITRDEAVTIAERMYTGKSKLCSSYAWDTALRFIDGETGTYAVNSTGGNYTGNGGLKNTGYHGVKNIYDMGGNVWEWTTEVYTYGGNPCVGRGGNYTITALDDPAGIRYCVDTSCSYDYTGLRCTLYM